MTKFFLFIILSIVYVHNLAYSQFISKSDWTAGINFSYLSSKHIAQFQSLPNVPNCCNLFTDATGDGYKTGLSLQKNLSGFNNIVVSIGFQQINGDFFETEPEWVIINQKLTDAKIGHYLYTNFSTVFLETNYKYSSHSGLGFFAGLNLGFTSNASFNQKEILLEPEFIGTFENGTRTRNIKSGIIENRVPLLLFANIGIEYEIVLDKYDVWILAPVFKFYYGLNSFLQNEKWRVMYFSVGLSFKFNPFEDLSSPLTPKYK